MDVKCLRASNRQDETGRNTQKQKTEGQNKGSFSTGLIVGRFNMETAALQTGGGWEERVGCGRPQETK